MLYIYLHKMKRITLILLFLFSALMARAQYFPVHEDDGFVVRQAKGALNLVTRRLGYIDSAYLWQPPPELILRVYSTRQKGGMNIDWHLKYLQEPARIQSDMADRHHNNFGFNVAYAGIVLGLSFELEKSDKTRNKSFTFGYNGMHWAVNFNYNMIVDPVTFREKVGTSPSDPVYVDRTVVSEYDCKMQSYMFDGYYGFNKRHFAFDAAYEGKLIQAHSSGSWMAAARYSFGKLTTDPRDHFVSDMTKVDRYNIYQGSIGFGYAYNVVFLHKKPKPVQFKAWNSNARQGLRNITLSMSLIPMFTVYNKLRAHSIEGDVRNINCRPIVNWVGRVSFGVLYNRFAFGARYTHDRFMFKSDHQLKGFEEYHTDSHWKGLFHNMIITAYLSYNL